VAGRRRRQLDSAGRGAAGSGGRRAVGGLAGASQTADTELNARGDATACAGRDADPEAVARQICLRMLTAAPRTQAQLAAAMRRRGVPEDAAAAVLARFAEVKLIDDAMFARAWVDSRHYGRGLASRALGAELRQRGVARDDIQAALSALSPDVELETARELVARRLPGTAGMPVPARMRRLVGVLARKGYSAGLAYRVVREALEAEAGDDPVPPYELADPPEPDGEDEPVEM
jgi:regulatory protein